jgi:hypothetical protein
VSTWKCPGGRSIAKVASTGSTHLLVATGQGHLYLLESSLSGLACTASTELNVDIACIDIAHWEESGEHSATPTCIHSKLTSYIRSDQDLSFRNLQYCNKVMYPAVFETAGSAHGHKRYCAAAGVVLWNVGVTVSSCCSRKLLCCRGSAARCGGNVDSQAAGVVPPIHEVHCGGIV